MADKPWKAFERETADLLGGRRFWANSGESIDVESPVMVVQCKHVRTMSLASLTRLAEQIEVEGSKRSKLGIAAVKYRCGRGRVSAGLVVMTFATYRRLNERNG